MASVSASRRSEGRRVSFGSAPRSTALATARASLRNSGPWPSGHGPSTSRRSWTVPLAGEVALFGMCQLCHSRIMTSETNSSDPGFGRSFTPHMVVARYRADDGWGDLDVVPFRELSMSPAAMVFHYGQAIFEGLKAFRQPDGSVALFRPDENAARFDHSAR